MAVEERIPDPPAEGEAGANPPPGGESVTLSRQEHEQLLAARAEVDQLRYAQSQANLSVEQRVEQIEQRYRRAATAGAISDALGMLPFTSDAARSDARALLQSEVEVRDEGGEAVAYHRPTGRPLAQVDRGVLESRFAHLIAPSSRGGSGATASVPSPGQSGPPGGGSLGEQLIRLQLQRQGGPKTHPMFGVGRSDGRPW